MGLQKEVWKNELLKRFRAVGTHLDGVPDYSSDVINGKIIHLADIGADPDVLVNNTSYPIATVERTDADLPLTLNLFETVNTKVPYQSLFNLPYDKVVSIVDMHKERLMEYFLGYGTHAVAPTVHTANTPVLVTTGAVKTNLRKALTIKDLTALKKAFDDLKIPKSDRRLILCSDHVEDLLNLSPAFEKMYNVDTTEGRIGKLMGFDMYEYVDMPVYDPAVSTGTKKAYGATVLSTDAFCSIAFYTPRIFKAVGEAMQFLREAKDDPENRQTTVGFSLRGIVLPKKSTGEGAGIGAIRSAF